MANYSISPALKAAFEQIYGPPYLARVLFVELGPTGGQNNVLQNDGLSLLHTRVERCQGIGYFREALVRGPA